MVYMYSMTEAAIPITIIIHCTCMYVCDWGVQCAVDWRPIYLLDYQTLNIYNITDHH